MNDLKKLVEEYKNIPSDINEHLQTLVDLAQGLDVVEFGVRNGISTAALLLGAKSLISYDIEPRDVSKLQGLSYNFKFIQADDLEIPQIDCDMLFIDTFHSYAQLFAELSHHADGVRKQIVMHDTRSVFSYSDQQIPEGKISNLSPSEKQGLIPAIEDFLKTDKGNGRITKWWSLEYYNNNGLFILTRI